MKIQGREVGTEKPCYIIAEMSGNHDGNLEAALKIVHAAKEAGADAIKLQTYRADTITLKSDKPDFLIPKENPWSQSKTLYELYEKAYTPWEWHKPIFDEARKLGLHVFSSPFDETAVDLLEELGAPVYKVASPEITHIPLLKRIGQTRKPVIVSTGVAEISDIDLALKTLRAAGTSEIAVLKCTSSYPTPPDKVNLRTMQNMKDTFQVDVGISDHTLGIGISVAAVALGASIIEKHLTLSKDDKSVDSFFSLDRSEFKHMVEEVRRVEKALGQVTYELDEEGKKNSWGRRSLYVSQKIKRGERFSSENIKCVRPCMGLHPRHYIEVLGKVAKQDLDVGDRLSFGVIE